jgi:hypothetical protein
MPDAADFQDVSTTGLESSPVAPALAGLRANEARYFANVYVRDALRRRPTMTAETS